MNDWLYLYMIGGTFAMYSLLCRNAKVGMIPNQQAEDANVSNYQLELPNNRRTKRASTIKNILENSPLTKFILLMISMLGTSMLIGDGILTPCITGSLLSTTPFSFFQFSNKSRTFYKSILNFFHMSIQLYTVIGWLG